MRVTYDTIESGYAIIPRRTEYELKEGVFVAFKAPKIALIEAVDASPLDDAHEESLRRARLIAAGDFDFDDPEVDLFMVGRMIQDFFLSSVGISRRPEASSPT